MLRNSSRWVAFALTALALVAFAGDRSSAITTFPEIAPVAPVIVAPVGAVAPETATQTESSRIVSRVLLEDAVAPRSTAEMEPAPVALPEPDAPAVAVAPVRVAPVAVAPAMPATCAANQFCYPRVGIVGTIVPYNDCTGTTDVGTSIRSIVCVSPNYLAAHAYTQFGRIAGWRAGDVVFAYGSRYVVYDGFTQNGCVPPARSIAPLSLQTSLTPATCGPILVVQARPG